MVRVKNPGEYRKSDFSICPRICVGWSMTYKKVSRTGFEPAVIGRRVDRLRDYATLIRFSDGDSDI